MKFKKLTSVVLAASMLLGFAGCSKKNEKAVKQIEDLMEDYVDALNDFDCDGVLDLTNWEDDDKDYEAAEEVLDINKVAKYDGEGFASCARYIASTIKIDYDSDDIDIDGDKASVKVKYELVDWKSVYFGESCIDYADVLSSLRGTRSTISEKGKLSFELEKGEWKISKISNLNQVFDFINVLPEISPEPLVTDAPPIDTEPSADPTGKVPGGTDFADSYDKAIDSYLKVLDQYKDQIADYENNYYENHTCGLYDIDGNNIPELYFLACEPGAIYACDLYIYTYNEYAGEAVPMIIIPNILYLAGGGGEFLMYTTPSTLVITYAHGEESLYTTETHVFDQNFYEIDSYYEEQRMVWEDDDYSYTFDYFTGSGYYTGNGTRLEKAMYESSIRPYVNSAEMVLADFFYMNPDDIMYPLISVPSNNMIYHYEMVNLLNALKQ